MNKRARFKRGQQVIVKAPSDWSYAIPPSYQRARATVVVARSRQVLGGGRGHDEPETVVGVEFHNSDFCGHNLCGKLSSSRGQWIPLTRLHVAPDRKQP